jgi:hypothetical protein
MRNCQRLRTGSGPYLGGPGRRKPLICALTGSQGLRLHTLRAFTHKAG